MKRILLLLVCVLCSLEVSTQVGPRFPAAGFPLLGPAWELRHHDWTGDGIPDVVALHSSEHSISFTRGGRAGVRGAE